MFWNVRAIPAAVISCGFNPAEAATAELELAGIRLVDSREQIEHCRFAGAVGSDQTVQRSRRQIERKVLHGLQAAKAQARAFGAAAARLNYLDSSQLEQDDLRY